MRFPQPLALLALAALLGACSSGPPRKIHPSTASIQQLAVLPDGQWNLTLRIENFSNVPMHYDTLDATLSIDGVAAGELHARPDITITGNSGEVVEARLQATTRLPAGRDFAYRIEGRIRTSDPKANFDFERTSRLSPVPGVAGTWR
ncbi:hypothetical protein [Dokdonella sp.]|uniref:hypothetical protein n=1 Tax=Dokdonella sp. TaxID=2291710 RepID=UPI0031C29BD0|nr:LEA type 2 family protein [Dokdonella sp.]